MPVVSVIMSVYNGEKYLKDSVESILNQTFSDFEFIITDDCSTDNTLQLLKKYEEKDDRIKVLINTENLGLTKSLNKMIDIARGEYIARMDADDISLVHRFEKQVLLMRENPNIGVCATNIQYFGLVGSEKTSTPFSKRIYSGHEAIKTALLFINIIPHASVLIRKKVIDAYQLRYDEKFPIIQDYELWSRMICITDFFILPEILCKIRITGTGITGLSEKRSNERDEILLKIYRKLLKNYGIHFDENELYTHFFIVSNRINDKLACLNNGKLWLKKLCNFNRQNDQYDQSVLDEMIGYYWYNLCTRSIPIGLSAIAIFCTSTVGSENQKILKTIRLIVKYFKTKFNNILHCS